MKTVRRPFSTGEPPTSTCGRGIDATPRPATVAMPGTCGELVQGTMEGVPFLVSCPVPLFSHVTATVESGDPVGQPDRAVVLGPADSPKALAAARALLGALGVSVRVRLAIRSSIPRGKGLASSTADVGATLFALARALGVGLTPADAARLAVHVEPTDGSLFPGVVLFDHRGGRLYQPLGVPPPMLALALDFGGEVDTVAFNRVDRSAILREVEPLAREALGLVAAGIAEGDPRLVGQGATISARANQRVLAKPQLDAVIALGRETSAVGVNVGHSGTVIGLLFDARRTDGAAELAYVRRRLPQLAWSACLPVIGGGPVYDP